MFAEDLSAFFSVADFAVAATLDGASVQGIFERPTATAQLGAGLGVATYAATFLLPAASVPSGSVGKVLAVPGQGSWQVAEVMLDGTGLATLGLEEA